MAVAAEPSTEIPGALEHVRAIAPYQAGKPIGELAREFGLDPATIIKLASNENPLGVPDSARKAMAAAVEDLGRYPDSNGFELKAALAVRYDVPTDWITLGNGSNDILELAAAATLTAGRSCIYAQHAFAVYALATQARGARAIVVPARQLGHDLDAMLAAVAPDTALIYIANPNNPTGTHLPAPAIDAFLARVPRRVVVVLDEAYNEYLPPELRVDSTAWVRRTSERDCVAHLFEGLRPGRTAGRLRTGAARAHRSAEPGTATVQRQHRGAGCGGRGACR